MPTPALDFLRKVQVWQEDDANKTAGLVVVMPDSEDQTLAGLLRTFDSLGATSGLENRARYWLIGYRELEDRQRVLTEDQRAELHAITDRLMSDYRQAHAQPRQRRHLKPWQWITIAAASVLIGFGAAGLVHALAGSSNGAPPPARPVAQAPQHPAPGLLTDLQQFRADWNVPAVAIGAAGSPQALVLLQDGLYYPSPWTVPAGDPGWQDNLDDAGFTVTVHGSLADVTDSTGITYTVAVGQPFVTAGNTQLVLRVLRDGTIQSMPGPHAIAVRHRI